MHVKPIVIIVTGKPASGKTTFLSGLSAKHSEYVRGILSPAAERKHKSGRSADKYFVKLTDKNEKYVWAEKQNDKQFEFHYQTLEKITGELKKELESYMPMCCVLDDLGPLELEKKGHYDLFNELKSMPVKLFVISVKKRLLDEVIRIFSLEDSLVIDLDSINHKDAEKITDEVFSDLEARAIGTFAGIGGLTEVGLGSLLHIWKIPLKGHFLAYLQNILLIVFGKELNGKGLYRISFISALLKAFSPMQNPVRPMFYIWLQGSLFASSVLIAGWNIPGIILGSVLMSWLVLFISLLTDYIVFGSEFFSALEGSLRYISSFTGINFPGLWGTLLFIMIIKGIFAVLLAIFAYFGKFDKFIFGISGKIKKLMPHKPDDSSKTWKESAKSAFMEIINPKFMTILIISSLLILFFANLTRTEWIYLILRAFLISYLGFVLIGKISILNIVKKVDKNKKYKIEHSLYYALVSMWDDEKTPTEPPRNK